MLIVARVLGLPSIQATTTGLLVLQAMIRGYRLVMRENANAPPEFVECVD